MAGDLDSDNETSTSQSIEKSVFLVPGATFPDYSKARLFKLIGDNWEEAGTGNAFITIRDELPYIIMKDPSNGSEFLSQKIFCPPVGYNPEDDFKLQQNVLICWYDPENGDGFAISFLNSVYCHAFWDKIFELRSSLKNFEFSIPLPDTGNLDGILRKIQMVMSSNSNDIIIRDISFEFLSKLSDVFEELFQINEVKKLEKVSIIVKFLLMLGRPTLFNLLISDRFIRFVIKSFDFEEGSLFNHDTHRTFITSGPRFLCVIPLPGIDAETIATHTFLLNYIKDVLIAKIISDSVASLFKDAITRNNVTLLQSFVFNGEWLKNFFSQLRESESGSQHRLQFFRFLQEMFGILRMHENATERNRMICSLSSNGLLDVFSISLCDPLLAIRVISADVLDFLLLVSAEQLRRVWAHCRSQNESNLLRVLCVQTLSETDFGVRIVLVDVLNALLHFNENVDLNLSFFYDNYASLITFPIDYYYRKEVLMETDSHNLALKEYEEKLTSLESLLSSVEILTQCVSAHTYHVRKFLTESSMLTKVSTLAEHTNKEVVLSAIKFLDTVVRTKNSYLNAQLVQHSVLVPYINVLKKNSHKDSLIVSVFMNIVNYILQENNAVLVQHLHRYNSVFEQMRFYKNIPPMLSARFHGNNQRASPSPSTSTQSSPSFGPRTFRPLEDEDFYFEEADEPVADNVDARKAVEKQSSSQLPSPIRLSFPDVEMVRSSFSSEHIVTKKMDEKRTEVNPTRTFDFFENDENEAEDYVEIKAKTEHGQSRFSESNSQSTSPEFFSSLESFKRKRIEDDKEQEKKPRI